jgi:hypothetical protein
MAGEAAGAPASTAADAAAADAAAAAAAPGDDDSPFLFRARPGAPPALLAGDTPGRAAATGLAALPALLSAVCGAGLSHCAGPGDRLKITPRRYLLPRHRAAGAEAVLHTHFAKAP